MNKCSIRPVGRFGKAGPSPAGIDPDDFGLRDRGKGVVIISQRKKEGKQTHILVLALGLMVWWASVAEGAQYLTVNGADVTSITLELGQSRTVEVVSTDGTSYVDYVGFDNGIVLGTFSHLETKPEAGSVASAVEHNEPAFYGYLCIAAGGSSPGVHFVFQYDALQVGETDLKLYNDTFTSLIDSVHITVIPLQPVAMGTAFTYQGSLLDGNDVADGLYDLQFKVYDNTDPVFAGQQGSTIDVNDLDVIDGYFTVELDFGGGVFDGNARWLETAVRPGDSNDANDFVTVSPRQEVTPTPYALYARTDGDWRISGNDMYSIPSGNVGIGTTSPGTKLEIFDSLPSLRLNGHATSSAWQMLVNSFGLTFYRETGGGHDLRIDNSGNVLIRNGNVLIPHGNVGIGTASPAAKLDVDVSTGGQIGRYQASVSGNAYITMDAGTTQTLIGSNRDSSGFTGTFSNNDFGIRTNNVDRISVTTAGNVGIGTTSPTEKLEVIGNIRAWNGSQAISFIPDAANNRLHIDVGGTGHSNDQILLGDADVASNDVVTLGNVGIGTTNPQEKLHVVGKIRANGIRAAGVEVVSNVRVLSGQVYVPGMIGIGIETQPVQWVYDPPAGEEERGILLKYSSSARYKDNIQPVDIDFHKILQANPKSFTCKTTRQKGIGFIAEEFDQLGLCNLVIYDKDGRPDAIRYKLISVYLLEVIKDQVKSTEQLKGDNESLKQKNQSLEQRLAALEKTIQQLAKGKEFEL
jgi:hypothetical protein